MPCVIRLSDSLVEERVDEDMMSCMSALNMAFAKGMKFVVMDDMDGSHIIVNLSRILTIKELED